MEQALVSVVIPVYNVSDYLEECLDSVVAQMYRNLEIIIVDDGSTDGSAEICDAYVARDSRIKLIRQKNMGVVKARKRAVLNATGAFICFLDGDDVMEPSMIRFFTDNIENCDLITCGHRENVRGRAFTRTDSFSPGIYESKEELEYFISNMIAFENRYQDGLLPFLWNKMYRAELLKHIMDDIDAQLTYGEDRDILFRYVLKCRSIRITDAILYYYRFREDSAVHAANDRFMYDLNGLYLSLKPVFERHPLKEELMRQLQLFITSRVYKITAFMGFESETGALEYVFPFQQLKAKCRVVLYGAAKMGIDYYRQVNIWNQLELVLWVDKNREKYNGRYGQIFSPDEIARVSYDYIIIAVRTERVSNEIKEELVSRGVPEEKILWHPPIRSIVV